MHITELLVTAYDGDEPVFAVNLEPEAATVAWTGTDNDGDTAVDSTWSLACQSFVVIRQLMEDLAVAAGH